MVALSVVVAGEPTFTSGGENADMFTVTVTVPVLALKRATKRNAINTSAAATPISMVVERPRLHH